MTGTLTGVLAVFSLTPRRDHRRVDALTMDHRERQLRGSPARESVSFGRWARAAAWIASARYRPCPRLYHDLGMPEHRTGPPAIIAPADLGPRPGAACARVPCALGRALADILRTRTGVAAVSVLPDTLVAGR